MTSTKTSDTSRPVLIIVLNVVSFFMSHRKGIALAALEDGYRVVVCAALDADVSEMERMGIEFNTVPNIRGRSIGLNDLGFIFCLWWYIRKFKPTVLHLVTPKAILYGGALARLLRVNSVVFAFSGLGSTVVGKNFREKARRFIILYCYGLIVNYPRSFWIFQNSFDQRLIHSLAYPKTSPSVLLPGSGVNLDKFSPKLTDRKSTILVIFASRLLVEKGFAEFIEAARLLRERESNVDMRVVGSIDPYNNPKESEELLNSALVGQIITYEGACSDISGILRDADIFCFPSYYGEGLAKVLLEASATGLPIITTDHPGCREAIVDGQSGILVPIRNAVSVADAIEKLVNNENLRLAMGTEARRIAEVQFSENIIIDAHLSVYRELCGEG